MACSSLELSLQIISSKSLLYPVEPVEFLLLLHLSRLPLPQRMVSSICRLFIVCLYIVPYKRGRYHIVLFDTWFAHVLLAPLALSPLLRVFTMLGGLLMALYLWSNSGQFLPPLCTCSMWVRKQDRCRERCLGVVVVSGKEDAA